MMVSHVAQNAEKISQEKRKRNLLLVLGNGTNANQA
jgi:hypothetical protein